MASEEAEAAKPAREKDPPEDQAPKPTKGAPRESPESEPTYTTRWYWTSFVISLASLVVLLLYFDRTLPPLFVWAYRIFALLALVLVGVSIVGLVRRYRLIHAIRDRGVEFGKRGKDAFGRASTGMRTGAGRGAGTVGRLAGGITRFFVRLGLFVYRLVFRIVRLIELTAVWILILSYDAVYWVLFAAWWLAYHALRIAGIVLRFALRVVWWILRLPLKLPVIRKLWAEKLRPKILAKWDATVKAQEEKRGQRADRRMRLAAAKGKDPEAWLAEQRAHHWFPLAPPHEAKEVLRRRLEPAEVRREREQREKRERRKAKREKAKGEPSPEENPK